MTNENAPLRSIGSKNNQDNTAGELRDCDTGRPSLFLSGIDLCQALLSCLQQLPKTTSDCPRRMSPREDRQKTEDM